MAQIIGDKLFNYEEEEIPCRTREDVDAIILDNKYTIIESVYFIAKMGDTELLKYILEKTDGLIYVIYNTMIHYAAIGGQKDTVEYIFQRASMAEYHIIWEWAILGAAEGGHLDLLKEYEQKAIINEENIKWEYILYSSHDIQVTKYVCEKILIGGGTIPKLVFECSDDEEFKEYLNSLK